MILIIFHTLENINNGNIKNNMKVYTINKTIVIQNNILPFKGFSAVNLFGIIFTRNISLLNGYILNHESIHTKQILECGIVFFYILYLLEWLIKLIFYGKYSYYNISFEREAYMHERNLQYLDNRKHYSWISLIFK